MKKKKNRLQQHRLPLHGDGDEKTVIHTDGAARGNPGRAGIGVVLKYDDEHTEEIKSYLGVRTSNQAEYEALIAALKKAKEQRKSYLHIFSDSQLIVNQINGKWRVKNPNIVGLYREARELIRGFSNVAVTHVRRELNTEADRLANEAIDDYLNEAGE